MPGAGAARRRSSTETLLAQHAAGLAVLKTVSESQEIQSYRTDPVFLELVADIAGDALHAQHNGDAGSPPNAEATISLPSPVSPFSARPSARPV